MFKKWTTTAHIVYCLCKCSAISLLFCSRFLHLHSLVSLMTHCGQCSCKLYSLFPSHHQIHWTIHCSSFLDFYCFKNKIHTITCFWQSVIFAEDLNTLRCLNLSGLLQSISFVNSAFIWANHCFLTKLSHTFLLKCLLILLYRLPHVIF